MRLGAMGSRGGFGSSGVLGGVGYNPVTALGTDLIAYWDANRSDLITQSGGAVSSWKDIKSGYDMAQATGSAQPIYSASSFNNGPGISFDGIDDTLACVDAGLLALLPVGSDGSELWILASQDALVADTNTRLVMGYSNTSTINGRNTGRSVAVGVNRTRSFVGDGAAATGFSGTVADLSSRYVERFQVGSASTNVIIGGVADANFSVTPNTGAARVRFGSSASSTAANFWQGKIAAAAITKPLSTSKAAAFQSFLSRRV